jgi:hypothetical protein
VDGGRRNSMVRKVRVQTNHDELYQKLNSLNFTNSVMIKKGMDVKDLSKVIKNINRRDKCIDAEHIGDYIILKKLKPLDMNVYRGKKR